MRIYEMYNGTKFESDAHIRADKRRELNDAIDASSASYTSSYPNISFTTELDGRRFRVQVPRRMKIFDYKLALCNRASVNYKERRVRYMNQVLDESATFENYHVINDSLVIIG